MALGKQAGQPQTVSEFLASLPPDRRKTIDAVRKIIRKNLPKGYQEGMGWGMIMYVVPLSRFAKTYNGHPLCHVGLGSQKNYCALYLMSAYGNASQQAALADGFKRAGKKLAMGKACVRFRSVDDLALDAIADVVAGTPPERLIAAHEAAHGGKKRSTR